MSRFVSRHAIVIGAVGCCALALGQPSQAPRLPDAVSTVARLVAAAFPEWAGVARRYQFSTGFIQTSHGDPSVGSVTVEVLEGTRPIPGPEDLKDVEKYFEEVFLLVTVDFDPRGQIRDARFSGRGVRQREGNELRRLVDAHPEWTDAQVIEAMKAAGAPYGPDQREALLRRFRELDLESIVGQTSLDRAEFQVRDVGAFKAGLPAADLRWVVYLNAQHEQGLTLTFEPFEGRLIDVSRYGLKPRAKR